MYTSNKMEHFSYKEMGVVWVGVGVSRHLKEELTCAIDKRLQDISNKNNVIWNSYVRN